MILNVLLDNTFCVEFTDKIKEWDLSHHFKNVFLGSECKLLNKDDIQLVDYKTLQELANHSDYDSIVVHYLTSNNIKLINSLNRDIKICWVFYGAEIFSSLKYRSIYLTKETRSLVSTFNSSNLKNWFWQFKNGRKLKSALNKIDHIAMWIDGDFDFLQNHKKGNYRKLDFCYPAKLLNLSPVSKDIVLIGNNGFESNNHINAIDYVVKNKLHNSYEIKIMLSPHCGEYTEKVKMYASKTLGSKVNFVEDRLAYDDFLKLLSEVKVAIFPHLRSQGGVTTRSLLYFGKTVVCYSTSNMMKKLSHYGCKVIDINDPFRLLDQAELSKNKSVIEDNFGLKAQKTSMLNIVNSLAI